MKRTRIVWDWLYVFGAKEYDPGRFAKCMDAYIPKHRSLGTSLVAAFESLNKSMGWTKKSMNEENGFFIIYSWLED